MRRKGDSRKVALWFSLLLVVLGAGCQEFQDTQSLHFTEEEEKQWKTYAFPESSFSVELPVAPIEMPAPSSGPGLESFKAWSVGGTEQKLVFLFAEIKRTDLVGRGADFGEFVEQWFKTYAVDGLPSEFDPDFEVKKLSEDDYLGIVRASNGKQSMVMTSCLSLGEDGKTLRMVMSGVSDDGQMDYRNFRRAMKSVVFGGKTCDAALPFGEEFHLKKKP